MKNKIYLDEKLTASDPTSKWISDFVKSDNPKFAGKSKKERIRMALGASYAAKGKSRNEEVESVDEVSMGLLTRYKQKAGEQASAMNKAVSDVASSSAAPEHKKVAIDALVQKGNKRFSGIVRATNKQFAKEEIVLEMDKSQPSSSRGAEGLPLGKKAEPAKTDKVKQDALKVLQKQYKKVKEEVEELDEISKKTLGSYVSKASVDMANRTAEGERKRTLAGADYAHNISRGMSAKTAEVGMKKDYDAAKPDVKKAVQRMRGIDKAVGRLTKEEVEELDELSKSTLASYAKKAVDSGNTASRIASRSASLSGQESKPMQDIVDKRGEGIKKAVKRLAKEEVEELDELSKSTLASYAKKASHDAKIQHGIGKDFERIAMTSRKPSYKTAATTWEKKYKSDARRREAGVEKAIDRLAKEEVEIDEATPSSQQVKQAIGIARDKRYAGGNVTGAVKAMDKINKGLAQHPVVKKELQKQNEATSAYGRINSRFKTLSGRSLGAAAKEYGDEAKRLQKEIDAQKAENERRKAAMKTEDTELEEAGRMQGGGKDPCWKGYKMIGTKKKGGREVPNCVPTEEVKELKTFKALREEINGNS